MVFIRKLSRAKFSSVKSVLLLACLGGLLVFHHSVNQNESSSINQSESNHKEYALAKKESLGFFNDIDKTRWQRMKDRFQSTRPNEYKTRDKERYKEHAKNSGFFWMENFDPEFTCEFEKKYGILGDGGKWICDAHRIKKKNCLVYSVGSRGEFSFEEDVRNDLGCEVHTFDRDDPDENWTKKAKKLGVDFHHTSLGSATEEVKNGKRFREIIPDLKHQGKTVDIMKIDCEKCEWDQYLEWLEDWKEMKLTVRQLVIEVHMSPLPQAPDFFHKMWEQGYVIFHKEPNTRYPNNIEYALILLHPDFQK